MLERCFSDSTATHTAMSKTQSGHLLEAMSLGGTVSSSHHGHLKAGNGDNVVVVTRTATNNYKTFGMLK